MATPPRAPVATETFERRILDFGGQHARPDEIAALLKDLYAEDPQRLFDALMAIANGPLETRRLMLPLLANALTLWPEAEGRYVFPVADAYGEIDLPGAAEWAAAYLDKTGRDDLAAATLVARLAETAEPRALTLLATLPNTARIGALQSLAYHLRIDDLNHLAEVCLSLDPRGDASFAKLVFERLGMERLDETVAWIASTPNAQAIPGAVAAIARAMVRSSDPKKAIAWADALPGQMARAQAICSVYQQWAQNNPDSAIEDILGAYDGAPLLMADVFKGATEHHGEGPSTFWDKACTLQNPSARAYAISALIKPMLVTAGESDTQAKIAALPPGSLERTVAEQIYRAALKDPAIATALQARAESSRADATPGSG